MSGAATDLRRVVLGGAHLAVDDDQPTFWDRVAVGRWEPGTVAALSSLLGPDATFLDLGAWIGPLSLLAAARGARVIAVEADPAAQNQFRRNLAANPELARRIELIEGAVSPDTAPVRLGARRKPGDSMSSILLAEGGVSWTAPAVTPAMLAAMPDGTGPLGHARASCLIALSSREPAPTSLDNALVIKIDIEGGEYALLPHLGPLLARPRLAVLVSFHPVILAEAGEPEPERRLREAVAAFEGWEAAPVTASGAGASNPLRAAEFDLAGTETWLFRKG